MRVFLNGMGRIGRLALRRLAHNEAIDIIGINDLTDCPQILHLIKYDSTYGIFEDIHPPEGKTVRIGRQAIECFGIRDPSQIPYADLGIELVLECTGAFTKREQLEAFLAGGAPRVLISSPGKGIDFTMVPGINDEGYHPEQHRLVSAASCTTNCAVPTIKALDDAFGVVAGNLTTIHAYTNDQQIIDKRHSKDWRRARSAAINIIPTSSGAGTAVAEILPHLKGKLNAGAMRVPVATGSAIDCTLQLKRMPASVDELNAAFTSKANGDWKGFFQVTADPIVSSDVIGNDKAAVVDSLQSRVIAGDLINCLAWYDNEWGYTCQYVRAAEHLARVHARGAVGARR